MSVIKNLCFGLVLLLLLAPAIHAAEEGQIHVLGQGQTINVTLLVFEGEETHPDRASNEQIMRCCRGEASYSSYCSEPDPGAVQDCWVRESQERIQGGEYGTSFRTVEGANFTFTYFSPSAGGFIPLPGCTPRVSSDRTIVTTNAEGEDVRYWYATCTMPENIYDTLARDQGLISRRLNIRIHAPAGMNNGIEAASYSLTISDTQTGEISPTVVNRLKEMMQGFVSGGGPAELRDDVGSLPCLGVFLILGLLLASMYFAGKSPITLLDIATPRLPAPKGIVAGGQILAPFGYTEMKRVLKNSMGKGVAALGQSVGAISGASAAGIAAGGVRGIRGRIGGFASGGRAGRGRGSAAAGRTRRRRRGRGGSAIDPDEIIELRDLAKAAPAKLADKMADAGQQKAMAANMAIMARFVGMSMEDARSIAKRMPMHYGDREHRLVGNIVERLERMGGLHGLEAAAMRNYMVGLRTWMSLEVLTGHPDVGKRSLTHQFIQKNLGRMFAADRFAILGPVILGSVDSTVRTARVGRRGLVAAVKHSANLARDTARTVTTNLVGGERAFRSRAATARRKGGAAGWAYGQMTKHSKDIQIGTMYPVHQKMAYFYRQLKEEIIQDEIRHVLKQIFKEHGLNFNMSEHQLMAMGYKDMDVLAMAGYRALNRAQRESLERTEAAIRTILTDPMLNSRQKLEQLMRTGAIIGAHTDPHGIIANLNAMIDHIDAQNTNTMPEYIKMIWLKQVLEEHHNMNPAARVGEARIDDNYYCLVGRDHIHGGDLWQMMVLRTMAWDAQHGHLVNGGIKEELQSAWLNVVNREVSLRPTTGMGELPEFMRNAQQLQKIENRVRNTMFELIEDRPMFEEYLRKNGKTYAQAEIHDFVEYMKGGGKVPRTHEQVTGWLDGRTAWWEEDFELAPLKGAFKVDMKRHWLSQLDERENLAFAQWVESRFTRSYTPPFNPSIEARLDRMGLTTNFEQRRDMAKRLWVQDYTERDLMQRFNAQFTNNAYGTMHELSKSHTSILASFTQQALRERGLPSNDWRRDFVDKLDVRNPDHLRRFRYLLQEAENIDGIKKIMSDHVSYDDVAKGHEPWVMLREGGMAPYRKGMPLSDGDRVLGGEVALKDNKGQWRTYVPDDVSIKFTGDLAERLNLENQWNSVNRSHVSRDWHSFMNNTIQWARENGYDYEREKVLGAVLWRYGQATYDYTNYWRQTGVKVIPKREATPLAPNLFRMFGWEAPGLMKAFKPIRDIGLHVGDYVSRVALEAGGQLHRASWDITPYSEYYKQISWRLAHKVFSQDLQSLGLTEEERKAYRAYAVSHAAYHQVWDYAIDRNPWVRSTSFGSHQSWNTFFHCGPSKPYAVTDNLRAYMSRGEWINFMVHSGFIMNFARDIMMPYVNVTRGMQMSLQGYANKWESGMDPLKQYNYTSPRLLETLQAMNPLSSTWSRDWKEDGIGKWNVMRGAFAWFGSRTNKLNLFESSLEKRQLAGKAFMKGLAIGPQDIWLQEQGAYSVARTGAANPGTSFYDYRGTLKLDPRMSEYMLRMGDSWTIYSKYLQESAMNTIQRRTVSAEALSIRRSVELRGFGISQNAMFGWISPLMFGWHSPVPGFHKLGFREISSGIYNMWKHRGEKRFVDSAAEAGSKIGGAFKRAAMPWKIASVAYCPVCYRAGHRGGACRGCTSFLY